MLKKILIFLILAVLIGGALFQNVYLDHTFSNLSALTADVKANYESGNMEETRSSMNTLYSTWEKTQPTLATLLEHEEIDNIHLEMSGLNVLIDTDNKKEIPSSIAKLQYLLNHIPETDSVSLSNIL